MNRLFQLRPYGNNRLPNFPIIIMTANPVEDAVVASAWAYALRHTAKGLDLPDHDEALKLMFERHPSWQIIEGQVQPINVALQLADKDEPENV